MKFKRMFCRHRKQRAVCVDIKHNSPFIVCICEKCEKEFGYYLNDMQHIIHFHKHPKIRVDNKIWKGVQDAWETIEKEQK